MMLRGRTLILALAAAASFGLESVWAADAALSQAVALYNQKHYAEAAKAFSSILKAEPKNVAVALYLANSYYALGQTHMAEGYYKWIAGNFPGRGEAATANTMISRLATAAPPAQVTPAQGNSNTSRPRLANAVDLDAMIRVVRPQADHPYCSKEFIQSIKQALQQCPPKVVSLAAAHDCRVCITPSLIDRNPELRNTRPRGYEDGRTYKNTPAMYDGKEVVVCEYAVVGDNDTWQPMKGAVGALRHEFGHAVDHYLGNVSRSEEFRHIYYLDSARVDGPNKEALAYYLQQGTAEGGPSETFAQACCIIFGGDTEEWRQKRDEQFQTSFSNVIQYVRKRMDSI